MTARRRHILVVEDDQETAGQLVESLTANGYQVNFAANGSDALSLGLSADYAVITVDRILPDTVGRVRRKGRRPASLSTHSYGSWRRVLPPCT